MSDNVTVIENQSQLALALQKYDPRDFNLLLPTTDLRFIAPDHRVVINQVKLDPHADFWEDSSWTKKDGKWVKEVRGYSLSKRGLDRLMQIAGIDVVSSVVVPLSDGSRHATVVIRFTTPEGEQRTLPQNYTWEVPARIEEAKRRMQAKIEKDPAKESSYRSAFEKERHRIIVFATGLAETGALNRALRRALTVKNLYSPDEIAKPFVCLRVIPPRRPEIDFDHPFIRRLMSLAMLSGQLMPEFTPQPTLHLMEARPFVDPTSDAVAAGEVDTSNGDHDPKPAQPALIEEAHVPIPEPELVTEDELRDVIYNTLPDVKPAEVGKIATYYLKLAGGDPTDALAKFEKKHRRSS